ncbi:MAG: hypothetical protein RQ833_04510 [Sphingomonadaceae bacterium]|nr:hypothetical protein [Sphingomonadaceae bacterium]
MILAFAAAALAAAQPAAAPAATDEVVIEGRRITRSEAARIAADHVRGVSIPNDFGQLARWNTGICPKVVGIAPVYAEIVIKRVAAAVRVAGASLAGDGCKPNLVLAFALDSKALAQAVAREAGSQLFQSTPPAQKRVLLESDLPVRWIYALGAGSGGGAPLSDGAAPPISAVGAGPDRLQGLGGPGSITTQRTSGSLIDTNLVVSITGAFVIVDLKRAEGFPLLSVASYAARVALAETKLPPRPGEADSILALFDRAENKAAAQDLSAWDRALLVALYRTPPEREARYQKSRVQAEMVRALTGGAR